MAPGVSSEFGIGDITGHARRSGSAAERPAGLRGRRRQRRGPGHRGLEAVEPVIEFPQAKYPFADPVDALAGIDSRPDLLKMDLYKFENLIRQLFEAMGLEVRV